MDTNVCEVTSRVHPVKNRCCQRNSQVSMSLPWIRLARYTSKAEIKQRHRMTERHNHKKQTTKRQKKLLSLQSVHEETVTLQKHMHYESKKPWKSRDPRTRKQNMRIYSSVVRGSDWRANQISLIYRRTGTFSESGVCHHFPHRSQTTKELFWNRKQLTA